VSTGHASDKANGIAEAYEAIGVDQLVVYCAREVLDKREECTLERLVYECFTRFPKKFGLSRYPQWPDSTKVYRSWRRCVITDKWLVGSPQAGFRMTSRGEKIADEVAAKLGNPSLMSTKPRPSTRTRGKEEAVVRYLRKSAAFNRWISEKGSFAVSESELRSVLNATLETPMETLRENMAYYKENALLLKDSQVIEFLDECWRQHSSVLGRFE